MSEISVSPEPVAAQPKRRTGLLIALIIVAVVILLPLLYLGGNFMLPALIKSGYQSKNCGLVLGADGLYNNLYPAVLADTSIVGPVGECAVFTLASDNQQKKAWQDSYNAYKTYAETYPKGLFVSEVHEQTAVVLVAWSTDLLAQKKYEQAVGNLKLFFASFKDTTTAGQAGELMSQVYTAWGADQRASSDFAGSETTLKAFAAWAQDAGQSDSVKTAKHELAQTYLAWGLALQENKQFDEAKAKLDLAISTDPEPLAKDGPAAQAKAAQAKLYSQWGDDLLAKKDFAGAIARYKTVLTLVDAKDLPAAKDAVANGYLKWAASLSEGEDFLGALDQVTAAEGSAGTDAGKKSVEATRTDTYTAFSNSSGTQSQKAMQTADKAACEDQKQPDLPIFGLDKQNIQAALYGVDDKLPDTVAAKTPGALHYVACVELVTNRVETKTFYWATLIRESYTWNVKLHALASGALVATTSISGGTPPPLPDITRSNYIDILLGGSLQRYRGTNPDVADLAKWLLNVMK